MHIRQSLEQIYERLLDRYGPQHWWPADEPFEVIIGAILTQSTAWTNVEQDIILKEAGALNPDALNRIPIDDLADLIHPSGYYNAKARKIKAFVERLEASYGGSLERMLALDTTALRHESIYSSSMPIHAASCTAKRHARRHLPFATTAA